MRMYDIIEHKRDGLALSSGEIECFVQGYAAGTIPDYQASALLMAIFLRGMDIAETTALTIAMERSGDIVDLSSIPGITVDKHSTGGVGDKTTLAVVPIVAALGVPVAKMSGRGLGHTGGTRDKLESIPGLTTDISKERLLAQMREHGAAIIGQTGDLVPADKLIYALRDVTATVDSIPLIASSIMSKKLAAGSRKILLDVKTGSGAFMRTLDDALELARTMVAIGENAGRETVALVTNMDRPLGHAIGNALEVIEAVDTLKGHGPRDHTHECELLAAEMLLLAGRVKTRGAGVRLAKRALGDGSAFAKLCEIVAAQGGDIGYLTDTGRFERAPIVEPVRAPRGGFIAAIDTAAIGIAGMELGAGRERKDDAIDHAAGIVLLKNQGDAVTSGEPVAMLHTATRERLETARATFETAITYASEAPARAPLVFARVTRTGIELMV